MSKFWFQIKQGTLSRNGSFSSPLAFSSKSIKFNDLSKVIDPFSIPSC